MTTSDTLTAYGEHVSDLLPGLMVIKDSMTVDDTGMCRSSFTLEPKHGIPLQRALMRVEADLPREDADLVDVHNYRIRTEGQRKADALIRLIQSISAPAPH
ncbi:MAG TPA: hypothetical protein VHV57_04950 [Acidimicrobiales bacterium]|jgi:hypothetical protein|nr:hypothetical protein [Acidimicrobiales bacterium]